MTPIVRMRCPRHRRAVAVPGGVIPMANGWYVHADGGGLVTCPEPGCTRRMWTWVIEGRVSDTRCGARCMGAIGPACDCECGGQRHGVGA